MQDNWFRNRLTKAKQGAPMWAELADAVQEVFLSRVEPLILRLRGAGSVLTMAPEELDRKFDELGSFFYMSDRVDDADKPMALLQRLDEIHLKDTDIPLTSTLAREFQGMGAEWAPLFAPVDQVAHPYGSVFLTATEMTGIGSGIGDDWFMTARGVVRLPVLHLKVVAPDALETEAKIAALEADIDRYVRPLLPVNIVMDGVEFFVLMAFIEPAEDGGISALDIEQEFTAASDCERPGYEAFDIEQTLATHQAEHPYWYEYTARLDAMSLDCWTLDKPIPGAPAGRFRYRDRQHFDSHCLDRRPLDAPVYGTSLRPIVDEVPRETSLTPRFGSASLDSSPLDLKLKDPWDIIKSWRERGGDQLNMR